jgi:hypothetical protein
MGRASVAVFVMTMALTVGRRAPAEEQTVCPVMEGNPISKNVFVEYEGKRVYFCCDSCKAKFLKEPGKYLARLPQFSDSATHQEADAPAHEHDNGHLGTGALIVPLGISTFVLLTSTVLVGFLQKGNRKLLFPWHKRLAVATLLVAISHALCVLLTD